MYLLDIYYMIDKKYNDVLFVMLIEVIKWLIEDFFKFYWNQY